tara:strand:+ start:84 stop:821 length:738 start_codon:yes stop_codon:yes gene_type:complete
MVFPLAAVGAGLSAFSGASSALGGFFDNSENDAIHAANKRRVAEIDAANQQRHFQNLSIGAKFRNQKARTQANLFNIDTAASEARAASQREIDSQLDGFMLDNQNSYIKMMQGKRGPMSGRMNVGDRANSASFGRRQGTQEAAKQAMYDKLLSKDYVANRGIQNAKAKELSKVATAPIYQQYQTDYTPQAYKSKGFGDYLQLAGGLAGAAASGMSMFDKLKIRDPKTLKPKTIKPRTETHYGPAF